MFPHTLYQSNPGRNKREGSLILPVGVASSNTNTPLTFCSSVKLRDKKH